RAEGDTVRLDLGPGPAGTGVTIDHLELVEDLTDGQRVFHHEVRDESGAVIASGHTIGVRRLHVLGPVTTRSLLVEVRDDTGSAVPEVLAAAIGYRTGHHTAPVVPGDYRAATEAPDGSDYGMDAD